MQNEKLTKDQAFGFKVNKKYKLYETYNYVAAECDTLNPDWMDTGDYNYYYFNGGSKYICVCENN